MQEEVPIRESFAIPDDDIDIRLIQRQIANAIGASKNGGKKSPEAKKEEAVEESSEGVTLEHSTKEEAPAAPVEMPSLIKPEQVTINQASHSKKNDSHEDSFDINELVADSNAEISLDFLNQLTDKINGEMGATENTLPHSQKEDVEGKVVMPLPTVSEEVEDVVESNINNIEQNEEILAEATINQDNEKTIVTEQICEYPKNQFDTEYINSLDYLEGDKKYKKYVIYIDDVNQEFIDSLTIKERKDLFNSILREQDDIRIARREEEQRRKLITNIMIFVVTFTVVVPLMFLLVNKCLEATISNQERAQNNFKVLFREHGKIQNQHNK